MLEDKKRPELFQHVVDPYIAVEEAESFLEKGDIIEAEKALNAVMAAINQERDRPEYKGKNPPVFDYHPKVWRTYARIAREKGDEANRVIANSMGNIAEICLDETSRIAEEEFASVAGSKRSAKNWSKTAQSLEKRGLIAEAVYCYLEAYRLDEKDEKIAKSLLIHMINGRLYEQVEEIAEKCIKRWKDTFYKEMLGIALLFQKKYEEAIPKLREITELDPSKGMIWQMLSLAFGNLGRNREAAEALRKMIDLNFHGVQARRILNEIESIKIDSTMPGMTMRIPTAASVARSSDDSVVTQDDHIIMKLMMDEGAVSESTGMGPLAEEGNSWMNAVIDNLVAKGFAVLAKSRKAYLTEKGIKKLREL